MCLDCGRQCEKIALGERRECGHCGSRQSTSSLQAKHPSLLQKAITACMGEVACIKKMVQQEHCEDDYIIDGSRAEALAALKAMVKVDAAAEAREGRKHGDAGHSIWELRGVHLGKGVCRQKTTDDLFAAFVMWGKHQGSGEGEEGGGAGSGFLAGEEGTGRYNISKALRRLQNFALFQEELFEQFLQEPVEMEELNAPIPYSWVRQYVHVPVARGPEGQRTMENMYSNCQVPAHGSDGEAHDEKRKEDDKKKEVETRTSIRLMFGLFLLMSFDDVAVTGGEWLSNVLDE